ncbi:hypothetical protein scyTo_0006630 [Scyliorhinus torazame]|uniref:Uncharacterized protein n=1 Tax=Scyliorhinus torazame TaxID=75743 RepID=A0A401PJ29_SCYTO|nr:hypothetical protein [Scyliorhinus torazame]
MANPPFGALLLPQVNEEKDQLCDDPQLEFQDDCPRFQCLQFRALFTDDMACVNRTFEQRNYFFFAYTSETCCAVDAVFFDKLMENG